MIKRRLSVLLLLIVTIARNSQSTAFTASRFTNKIGPSSQFSNRGLDRHLDRVTSLRGGMLPDLLTSKAAEVASLVSTHLKSGPFGVVALTSIAGCVLVPITQYKNFYAISVGYGFSVAAMALTLRYVFATTRRLPTRKISDE